MHGYFLVFLALVIGISGEALASDEAGVCQRTPFVKGAIESAVGKGCDGIHPDDLLKVHELKLEASYNDNSFISMKSGDLAGLTDLQQLSVKNFLGESLPPDIFAGVPHLKTLSFDCDYHTCGLREFTPTLFVPLTELTSLFLKDMNNLTELPETIFTSLVSLKMFRLFGSAVEVLPADLFTRQTSLEDVSICCSPITDLPPRLLLQQKSLTSLYISDTLIRSIPTGFFNGTPQLVDLVLNNNPIERIADDVFRPLQKVATINLSNAAISSVEEKDFLDLPNLMDLSLYRNRLANLPANAFGSGFSPTAKVHLGDNLLTDADKKRLKDELQDRVDF